MGNTKLIALIAILLISVRLLAQENVLNAAKDASHFSLDNGLHLVIISDSMAADAWCRVYLDYPVLPSINNPGIDLITTQLVGQETYSHTRPQLRQVLQNYSITLKRENRGFLISSPVENTDTLLTYLSEMLTYFKPSTRALDEIKKEYNNIVHASSTNADSNLYSKAKQWIFDAEHPYAQEMTEESIDNLTEESCEAFYTKNIKPENTWLVIYSKLDKDEVKDQFATLFENWPSGSVSQPKFKAAKIEMIPKVIFYPDNSLSESIALMIHPMDLQWLSKEDITARLLERSFRYGLNQQGIASEIDSRLVSDRISGSFQIYMRASAELIDSSIRLSVKEITKHQTILTSMGYPLQNFQMQSLSHFKDRLKEPTFLANTLIQVFKTGVENKLLEHYEEQTNKQTVADLQFMAQKQLKPEQLLVVIIGNRKNTINALVRLARDFEVTIYGKDGEVERSFPKGFNAGSVIKNYLTAIGGEKKINKYDTYTIGANGTYHIDTMDYHCRWKYYRSGSDKFAWKQDIQVPDSNFFLLNYQICNKEEGYDSTMQGGSSVTGADFEQLKWRSWLVPEMNYTPQGFYIELVALEVRDDKEYYKILVKNNIGLEYYDLFALEDNLKYFTLKVASINDGKYVGEEIGYTDYKEIDKGSFLVPWNKAIKNKLFTIDMQLDFYDRLSKVPKELFVIPNMKKN